MSVFLDRVKAAFGKKVAVALNLAGLTEGEVRAEGAWVYDEGGRGWLDCGSFGLHLLGHRHPAILAAARVQLAEMGLGTRVLGNLAATRCAEAIRGTFPSPSARVLFANSGSEATEIAIKVALHQTGRREFIAFRGAYHGKTTGAWSLSDHPHALRGCDFGRFAVHRLDLEDREALRSRLAGGAIAGVFIEPIQGEGGIVPVSRAFLEDLSRLCREYETALILDEIQTGLGRCGRVWCAADAACLPDILLMGKTLGGGIVPIAAVIHDDRAGTHRSSDPLLHSSTFAGGAFACRLASAVLEQVCAPDFLDRVRNLGASCLETLRGRVGDSPRVREVRGEGLMVGIECASTTVAAEVLTEAIKRRLLLSFCLHRPEVLRFYPPAVIARADLERALDDLSEILDHAD